MQFSNSYIISWNQVRIKPPNLKYYVNGEIKCSLERILTTKTLTLLV